MGERLESSSSAEFDLRAAADFCELILHAAKSTALSHELVREAQRLSGLVLLKNLTEKLPYKLRISVPEGVDAYIVKDDDVVNDNPEIFDATEVRTISKFGVEFYDRETDTELRIVGYDFELSPVPLEPLDPPGNT